MEYRDRDFKNEDITLDGNAFTGCTFSKCRLIYSGAERLNLSACTFKADVRFVFAGAASNTVGMLTSMYHGGMRDIVEATFNNIRSGRPSE